MNQFNITSVKHQLDFVGDICGMKAIIDGVEMSIPLDPANRHYAAIMEQVSAGTLTIAEADNGSN
jgi:hypothetical protein